MTRDEMANWLENEAVKHVYCPHSASYEIEVCNKLREIAAALRAPAVTGEADALALVKRLRAFVPEGGWQMAGRPGMAEDAIFYEEGDETAPLGTEACAYNLCGKDQGRSLLRLLDRLDEALAAPPAAGAPPAPGWPDGNNAVRWKPASGCINCGEANDGGFYTSEGQVGGFCSQCWEFLRAEFSEVSAGAPPALVALVQRLQGAERAYEVRRTPATERYYLDALAAVQDWRPEPAPAPVAGVVHSDSRNTSAVRSCDQAQGRSEKDAEDDPACPGSPRPSVASPAPVPVAVLPPTGYPRDAVYPVRPDPAPVAPPAEDASAICACGHTLAQHLDGRGYDCKWCHCKGFSLADPAPPAVAGGDAPECPECDGDGYTEIGPIGDNFAMYQEACRACRATGRRRQEGQ